MCSSHGPLVIPVVIQDDDYAALVKYWAEVYFREVYGLDLDLDRNPELLPLFVREVLLYVLTRDHYIRRIIRFAREWRRRVPNPELLRLLQSSEVSRPKL